MTTESEKHKEVQKWTEYCHFCPECRGVVLCCRKGLRVIEAMGFTGSEADAANVFLHAIRETVDMDVVVTFLTDRQWDKVSGDGACRHNLKLHGVKTYAWGTIL